MSLIAITSVGDAPGATTSAFAMTLTWPPEPVLMAECAPSGGRILRGYFECQEPFDRGLWNLGLAAVRDPNAVETTLWDQVLPLDEQRQRMLLPGLVDPFMALQLSTATWERLAELFADLPLSVLADVGPIQPESPFPVLQAADLVLVVLRPTLAQLVAARVRLQRLRQALGPAAPVGLVVVGTGPYAMGDARAQLGDFAVVLRLPLDARSAQVLSDGGGSERFRRRIEAGALLRHAGAAARVAHRFAFEQRQVLRAAPDSLVGKESTQ